MTPLAVIGEAVRALRTRISKHESRATDFEKAVTDGFITQSDYIKDLYALVDCVKAENEKLTEKIEQQDAAIIEILVVVKSLKSA